MTFTEEQLAQLDSFARYLNDGYRQFIQAGGAVLTEALRQYIMEIYELPGTISRHDWAHDVNRNQWAALLWEAREVYLESPYAREFIAWEKEHGRLPEAV